ncbi:MAG: TrkA family potassium uptake protein [Candidatus Auribacterota bacterium]|jgi:trk system potassium uptake protein TrkA|nr:TrkA family potassium uptake protein [Candidatus Auribacterota bacterium]
MRQFLIAGLGNFGSTIAQALYERGCQVLAIDNDKEKVQDIADVVTQSIVMDVTDRDAIASLPLQPSDIAIISLGSQMEASILATLYFKEMGIDSIMAKAMNEDHGKILKLIGASEIIIPEKQMALRIADRLAHPNVLDMVSVVDGFSMAELLPLESYYGKSLLDLDIRRKIGIEIVAIKHADKSPEGIITERIKGIPSGDYVIERGDILVVVGDDKCIDKYRKM